MPAEPRYQCSDCPEAFIERKNFTHHCYEKHFGIFKISCPHCQEQFWEHSEARKHLTEKHKLSGVHCMALVNVSKMNNAVNEALRKMFAVFDLQTGGHRDMEEDFGWTTIDTIRGRNGREWIPGLVSGENSLIQLPVLTKVPVQRQEGQTQPILIEEKQEQPSSQPSLPTCHPTKESEETNTSTPAFERPTTRRPLRVKPEYRKQIMSTLRSQLSNHEVQNQPIGVNQCQGHLNEEKSHVNSWHNALGEKEKRVESIEHDDLRMQEHRDHESIGSVRNTASLRVFENYFNNLKEELRIRDDTDPAKVGQPVTKAVPQEHSPGSELFEHGQLCKSHVENSDRDQHMDEVKKQVVSQSKPNPQATPSSSQRVKLTAFRKYSLRKRVLSDASGTEAKKPRYEAVEHIEANEQVPEEEKKEPNTEEGLEHRSTDATPTTSRVVGQTIHAKRYALWKQRRSLEFTERASNDVDNMEKELNEVKNQDSTHYADAQPKPVTPYNPQNVSQSASQPSKRKRGRPPGPSAPATSGKPTLTCNKCGIKVNDHYGGKLYHANVEHLKIPVFKCQLCSMEWYGLDAGAPYAHVKSVHKTGKKYISDLRHENKKVRDQKVNDCYK